MLRMLATRLPPQRREVPAAHRRRSGGDAGSATAAAEEAPTARLPQRRRESPQASFGLSWHRALQAINCHALTYYVMHEQKRRTQRKRQAAEQRKPFAFKESYDVVIVGGGASGLACAVSCLWEARTAGAVLPSILLVEQGKRIGAPSCAAVMVGATSRIRSWMLTAIGIAHLYLKPLAFLAATLFAPLPIGLKNWASYGEKPPKAAGCCIPFRTKLRRCWKCLWRRCRRMSPISIPA